MDELGETGALDWSRVTVDSFSLRAVPGGDLTGANPVDRAKSGSRLHVAAEASGLPLALLVTAANTNDSVVFEALLDDLPAVRTPVGGRRCRPDNCHADKAYDHPHCRSYLARPGIKLRIARRGSSRRPGWAATGGSRAHDRLAGRLPAAAGAL